MTWIEQYYNFLQERIDDGTLIEGTPIPKDGIVWNHFSGNGYDNRAFKGDLSVEDLGFLRFCIDKHNGIERKENKT